MRQKSLFRKSKALDLFARGRDIPTGYDLIIPSAGTRKKIKESLGVPKKPAENLILIKHGDVFILYGLTEDWWKLAYWLYASMFKDLKLGYLFGALNNDKEKLSARLLRIIARKDDILRLKLTSPAKKTIEEKFPKSKVTSISFFGGKCGTMLASLSLATQMVKAEAQSLPKYFYFNSQDNSKYYAWLSFGIPEWFFTVCNATVAFPDKIGSSLGQPCPRAVAGGDDPYGELYTVGNTTTVLTPIIECIFDGMKNSCAEDINRQIKAGIGLGVGLFLIIVGAVLYCWLRERFAAPVTHLPAPPPPPPPPQVEEPADIPLQNLGAIHNRSQQNTVDDDILYADAAEDKYSTLSF